jgi:hypothetical protein
MLNIMRKDGIKTGKVRLPLRWDVGEIMTVCEFSKGRTTDRNYDKHQKFGYDFTLELYES